MAGQNRNRWRGPAVFAAAAAMLLALGAINSWKPPEERFQEAFRRHQGVVLLIKSGTDADTAYAAAVKAAVPALAGMGTVIESRPTDGLRRTVEIGTPPEVHVFDAHGGRLFFHAGGADRPDFRPGFDAAVRAVATHRH